jgi:hypothetical protein
MAEFSKYCKDENIQMTAPTKTENNLVRIKYPGKSPLPPPNKKFKQIKRIFGTGASLLKNFLVETSIEEPTWMEISNYNECNNKASWCSQEVSIKNSSSIKLINDGKTPSLVVCCVNIKSMVNPSNNKKKIRISNCFYSKYG